MGDKDGSAGVGVSEIFSGEPGRKRLANITFS